MGNRNQVASTSINAVDSILNNREHLIPGDPLDPADPTSQLTPTATLRPKMHVKRDSVQLTNNYLNFEYFSHAPLSVTLYFFAIESVKAFGNTDCYYIDTDKYPEPAQFDLPAGQAEFFPTVQFAVNTSYSFEELSFADNKTYPLIIEIRTLQDERVVERTYCRFINEEGLQIKALRQKLTLNERSFELKDIYGYRPDIVQDCVVCLTDPISTVVLPCRHFCLCLTCANIVRGQNNSKCPICRIPVEALLNIRMDS